jgi:hypothetical protein
MAIVTLVCAATTAACGTAGGSPVGSAASPDGGAAVVVRAAVVARPPAVAPAPITISAHAALTAVPRSYLGLSTEYWTLPQHASDMTVLERVLALLRVPGDGPLILRVGGDSADHAFWSVRPAHLPAWAFSVTPRWLADARMLVRRVGVRLIIDLNLVTDSPATAARWARAAIAGLPRGSVADFEIGNEPDSYSRAFWALVTDGRPFGGRALPASLSASAYAADFRAYAAALAGAAPGVPLAGPALANPAAHARWIAALLAGSGGAVRLITIHRYPYSACARPGSRAFPTVARLLSAPATVGLAASVSPAVALAHAAGLPIRMTELNSVTCGGRPGVSDTFATALWAPAVLFRLMRAGIDGVNVHVREDAVNAAFSITPSGLTARPLLYGLILFARSLGPSPRLVRVRVHAPAAPSLGAWAVRSGRDTLHVLIDNEGRRPVSAALHVPATGRATVERLLAPAVTARAGETLGGRRLGADGRWQGPGVAATVASSGARGYRVEVPARSAALVSLRIVPGALGVTANRATGDRRRRGAGRAPRGAASPRR